MKNLLTPEQVAQRLNISTRAAYDLLAPGGRLHGVRIKLGRRIVRVDAADLEAYLQELKGGAPHVAT